MNLLNFEEPVSHLHLRHFIHWSIPDLKKAADFDIPIVKLHSS